ncbi:uncharacterized protein VTP21DRAFT_4770 [Calcarisporiella thermophila]|uniref:uncharacterized protein n=1 Tax=Calcarisporiella thermophila TaxID=911321 RepID=UPI0037422C3F
MAFEWRDTWYWFKSLPFGLLSAPRIFTKILRPCLAHLRSKGVGISAYLDDLIILARSEQKAKEHTLLAVELLEKLGFMISRKKSILTPFQKMEHLGFILDTESTENCDSNPGTPSGAAISPSFGERQGCCCSELWLGCNGKIELKFHEGTKILVVPTGEVELEYLSSSGFFSSHIHRCVNHRKECNLPGQVCVRPLEFGGKDTPHKCPGDDGCGTRTKEFSRADSLRGGNPVRQLGCSSLCCQSKGNAIATNAQGDEIQLGRVLSQENNVDSEAHSRGEQYECRQSIENEDLSKWRIDKNYVKRIERKFGPHDIDLFADKVNKVCKRYLSWSWDPKAEAQDALSIPWKPLGVPWINPPWTLILRKDTHILVPDEELMANLSEHQPYSKDTLM